MILAIYTVAFFYKQISKYIKNRCFILDAFSREGNCCTKKME